MSDQRLQQLYDVYMKAKQRTGEQSSLTVDALRKQIEVMTQWGALATPAATPCGE